MEYMYDDNTAEYFVPHTPGHPMNWLEYQDKTLSLPSITEKVGEIEVTRRGLGEMTIEELVKELCNRDRKEVREQIRLAELDVDCE